MNIKNLSKFADWLEANPIKNYNCDNPIDVNSLPTGIPLAFPGKSGLSDVDELFDLTHDQYTILFGFVQSNNAKRIRANYMPYEPNPEPWPPNPGNPANQKLLVINIRKMITRG